jgi:hypothetical protein
MNISREHLLKIIETQNTREGFFDLIKSERNYQIKKWGDEFDKKNTPNDWISYIVQYTGKAVTLPWNANDFKIALVKVATLCMAAYEWCEKTNGSMPKRHYD